MDLVIGKEEEWDAVVHIWIEVEEEGQCEVEEGIQWVEVGLTWAWMDPQWIRMVDR